METILTKFQKQYKNIIYPLNPMENLSIIGSKDFMYTFLDDDDLLKSWIDTINEHKQVSKVVTRLYSEHIANNKTIKNLDKYNNLIKIYIRDFKKVHKNFNDIINYIEDYKKNRLIIINLFDDEIFYGTKIVQELKKNLNPILFINFTTKIDENYKIYVDNNKNLFTILEKLDKNLEKTVEYLKNRESKMSSTFIFFKKIVKGIIIRIGFLNDGLDILNNNYDNLKNVFKSDFKSTDYYSINKMLKKISNFLIPNIKSSIELDYEYYSGDTIGTLFELTCFELLKCIAREMSNASIADSDKGSEYRVGYVDTSSWKGPFDKGMKQDIDGFIFKLVDGETNIKIVRLFEFKNSLSGVLPDFKKLFKMMEYFTSSSNKIYLKYNPKIGIYETYEKNIIVNYENIKVDVTSYADIMYSTYQKHNNIFSKFCKIPTQDHSEEIIYMDNNSFQNMSVSYIVGIDKQGVPLFQLLSADQIKDIIKLTNLSEIKEKVNEMILENIHSIRDFKKTFEKNTLIGIVRSGNIDFYNSKIFDAFVKTVTDEKILKNISILKKNNLDKICNTFNEDKCKEKYSLCNWNEICTSKQVDWTQQSFI